MPKLVPAHREVIFASGVAEILCAAGLLVPRLRRPRGLGERRAAARRLPGQPEDGRRRQRRPDSTQVQGDRVGTAAAADPDDPHGAEGGPRLSAPVGVPAKPASQPTRARPTSLAPMILRMSTLFVRTLRDDPADAEVPSHRLLVRAGYIRRAAPGHLHLAAAGPARAAQRRDDHPRGDGRDRRPGAPFPALLPREPYEASGRWTEYGDGIFRLKDRKGGDYLLGPTHEEMFTLVGEGPVLVVQGPAVWRSTRSRPSTATRRGPAPACCAGASSS